MSRGHDRVDVPALSRRARLARVVPMKDSGSPRFPGWIRVVNQVIKALQGVGLTFSTVDLLAVPGRRTGRLQTTPVSPFAVEGHRYILSYGETQWVKNARQAGWGILSRGRRQTRVALTEVVAPESPPLMREYPRQIPGGVQFYIRLGLVTAPAGPDEFAAAAQRLNLFRIDPFPTGGADGSSASWRTSASRAESSDAYRVDGTAGPH